MENVHTFAYQYIDRGFAPIPVEFRSKACKLKDWQNLKLVREEVQTFFEPPCNVGVVLGDLSGGLVDIDLDCPAAIDLAPYILPKTGMIFGRDSKPRSHWIYKAPDCGKGLRLVDPADGMLVELRANGQMTVFPGSVHESSEEIIFEQNDELAEIEFAQLTAYTRQLAAASLILPYWEKGCRHDLALALSGTLLNGGESQENARRLLEALIAARKDSEAEDRLQCLSSTVDKLGAGEPIRGRGELAKLIGQERTGRFCEWLDLKLPTTAVVPGRPGEVTTLYGGPAPYSDTAHAERFAARNSSIAGYCHKLKSWLIWNGIRWEADEVGKIERIAIEMMKEVINDAIDQRDSKLSESAVKALDAPRLRSVLSLAQSQCAVTQSAFDADPWKLNCESGILDLKSGELLKRDPADMMRKLATVRFDHTAECPTFLTFLERIFQADAELIAFVQRAIGYSLTGRTDEQCMFVLMGSGANGKSTLIRVIEGLLGDYAQVTPPETLMVTRSAGIPVDVANLEGARFVSSTETEAGQRFAEAKIKQLTGGDRVSGRFLYGNLFSYTPQFKLWLATNKLPEIRGTDEGIWRRIYVVRFGVTIPKAEQDQKLSEKLVAELPGILNWAIEGCLEWQQAGLRAPPSVIEATREYRAEMDVVSQFIADCCVVEPKAEEKVRDLYNAFQVWCDENGEQLAAKKVFGLRLQELGFRESRSSMARKRRDIRLKSEAELLRENLAADFGSGEPNDASGADDANDGSVKYEAAD